MYDNYITGGKVSDIRTTVISPCVLYNPIPSAAAAVL